LSKASGAIVDLTISVSFSAMKEIRLKISDIFEIDQQIRDQPRGLAAITAYVLKHYAFLPKPIAVILEGDEIVISYPEEADTKREEAAKLAARSPRRPTAWQAFSPQATGTLRNLHLSFVRLE
jgi:hypothetical protein